MGRKRLVSGRIVVLYPFLIRGTFVDSLNLLRLELAPPLSKRWE